jgi:hypothetical protein
MIDKILDIIEEHGLGGMVRWILENNSSQALPYHNFSHSLWVTHFADQAYRYKRPQSKTSPKELIAAALFHDTDHSGGFFADDANNVDKAIACFRQFVEKYCYCCAEDHGFQSVDTATVGCLIQTTKYPLEPLDTASLQMLALQDEFHFQAQCLRDADMMQNCSETNTLLSDYVAIKQELFRNMSYTEYTEKSLEFLRKINYETDFGLEVGRPLLNKAIDQLDKFQRLVFAEQNCQQ